MRLLYRWVMGLFVRRGPGFVDTVAEAPAVDLELVDIPERLAA